MARRRELKPPLYYNPYAVPPALTWRIQQVIPASGIQSFCRGLRSIAYEGGGVSYYYPTAVDTGFRYEWHERLGRNRYALRAGIRFHAILGAGIDFVDAYCANALAYNDPHLGPPALPPRVVSRIEQNIRTSLSRASSWGEQPHTRFHVISYVTLPPGHAIQRICALGHGRVTVFRSRLWKHENISAVAVAQDAASVHDAQLEANGTLSLTLCLMSLVAGAKIALTTTSWPARHRMRSFLRDISVAWNRDSILYPQQCGFVPAEYGVDRFSIALPRLFECTMALSPGGHARFVRSLHAYQAAQDVSSESPTLGLVAFIAALAALAGPERHRCGGTMECSLCGSIPLRHDIVGDKAAIIRVCLKSLRIDPMSPYGRDLAKLLGRVYSLQRSGFVHDATFRHSEATNGRRLLLSVPGTEGRRREEYRNYLDLDVVREITSWVLLGWLAQQSGTPNLVPQGIYHLPSTAREFRYESEGQVRGDRLSCLRPGQPD